MTTEKAAWIAAYSAEIANGRRRMGHNDRERQQMNAQDAARAGQYAMAEFKAAFGPSKPRDMLCDEVAIPLSVLRAAMKSAGAALEFRAEATKEELKGLSALVGWASANGVTEADEANW